MPEPVSPRLAWPPSFDAVNGSALVDQGSPEEIKQCVGVVLSTPIGGLIDNPRLGIRDQSRRVGGTSLEELATALDLGEPRASTTMTASEIIASAQTVGISVTGGSQ
jgi:hypothetical protein